MKLSPFAAAACAGLFVSSLGAQEKAESSVDSGLKFTAGYAYTLDSDISGAALNNVTTTAYDAKVTLFTDLEDGSKLSLYGGYKQQNFDYDTAGTLADETEQFSLGGDFLLTVYESVGALITGDIDLSKTEAGSYSNAETYNVGAGVTYAFNDRLTAGLGAQYYSQAQDDSMILPLVYLDWKISERFSAKIFYPETVAMSFALDQERQNVLSLSANWIKETYSANDPVGSASTNSVLVDEFYTAQLDYVWQPLTWIYVQPYVSYGFERTWKTRSGDVKVAEYDLDDPITFGLNLGLKW